jgi:GT2 family glycosyltransferase
MHDIVIGIIHHSRIDLTINCIKSICEPRLKIQICLIDNNPQDRIKQIIASKFPHIDIVVNAYPQGFGFNQNMIMERYKGKYRAFMSLNNDTILKSSAIFLLYDYLFKDKFIGAVCPQMVDKHDNPQASYGPIPDAMTHILRIINLKKILRIEIVRNILYKYIRLLPNFVQQYLRAKDGYTSTREIPRISGACVLFKEKAILDVGGYDERFYMYSEDSDWSIRAKNKNFLLYLVTPAKVMHYVGASGSVKTKIELEKSMFLYIAKHQPRFKWIIVPSIAFLLVCIHIMQYVLCLLTLKSAQDKIVHKKLILLGLRKILKPI